MFLGKVTKSCVVLISVVVLNCNGKDGVNKIKIWKPLEHGFLKKRQNCRENMSYFLLKGCKFCLDEGGD